MKMEKKVHLPFQAGPVAVFSSGMVQGSGSGVSHMDRESEGVAECPPSEQVSVEAPVVEEPAVEEGAAGRGWCCCCFCIGKMYAFGFPLPDSRSTGAILVGPPPPPPSMDMVVGL